MTLSGDGDPRSKREHAKDYRRAADSRFPWLLPALVVIAVAVIVVVIVSSLL
ncbi:hypothetical protein [Homoserinibacter sp. GY 40078]|uniref:hypothetical protein n=1 Tax=Homoserinibacter sp. GY 40078 TaxID=2603275 RepID=UPI00164F8A1E|nr:hypothetical protein [Homoserinibacter sp. GY 40078]